MTSPSQPSSKQTPQKQTTQNQTTEPTQTEKDAAVTPSGPAGDNPSTAGAGPTEVKSNTPENNRGHINPSAPEDANITPGTAGKK